MAMLSLLFAAGCQTGNRPPPLQAMDQEVDLERFMGDWYVLANIPTFLERGAHNAVESYSLNDDGSIATVFTFNRNSFDGKVRTLRPTGFVYNHETNAEWRMQFLWPFKAAFLIIYLDPEYETTIIGVPGRSYLWIMARSPRIPEDQLQSLIDFAVAKGHDIEKIQRVPQQSLEERNR
jgi:apolipoprotein D and lipocalin family protein